MPVTIDQLPDDPAVLKKLLAAERADAHTHAKTIDALRKQIGDLLESLRLERYRHYSARSEKAAAQQELFDEADSDEAIALEQDSEERDTPPVQAKENKQRKTSRKPLPADLPRVRQVVELDETERQCNCGCQLTEIGEQISEQLDIIPAKVQVLQTVRKKYACKSCEEGIKTAPHPATLLPKAMASANTMAYIITAKYADGLPLYRLSEILKRHHIDLSRQTLSASVLATAAKLEPFMECLKTHLHQGKVLHMDETQVQVLNEAGKSAQSKSYMWVQRGGPPDRPVIHFTYDPSRAAAVPDRLLDNYQGVLMSDGYQPYRQVAAKKQLVHLCCWAHARRQFVQAKKVQPKGKTGRADKALQLIAKLYAVEKREQTSDAAKRHHTRQEHSVPVLQQLHAWLEKTQQQVPPKNAIGKAVNYTLKYWAELSRYTDNGAWPIDNNAAENAIRPFVIGRKNWLFSNSQNGAKASANLYSLIETAKANDREPYQYLCWLLNKLPETDQSELETLTPWNMEQLSTG